MQNETVKCDLCPDECESFSEWAKHFQMHLDSKTLEGLWFVSEPDESGLFRVVASKSFRLNNADTHAKALNRVITMLKSLPSKKDS